MNPTSAKILLRKMFARRKCAGFGIRRTFNSAQTNELLVHQGFRKAKTLVTRHSARFLVSPPQAAQPKGNSKCSVEVNPTSAKILRRKMLARRKSAGFAIRGTFHSAAPCSHMKFANTDAPATVSNPATTIDRPLIAPSTSPSSMALAVPSACAAEPMPTPFAMGSVI